MTHPFNYRLILLLARPIRYCLSISAHASPTCARFLVSSLPFAPPSTSPELRRVTPTTIDCLLGRSPSINLIIPAFIGDFYPRWRIDLFCLLTKGQSLTNGHRNALPTLSVIRTTLFITNDWMLRTNTSFLLLFRAQSVSPVRPQFEPTPEDRSFFFASKKANSIFISALFLFTFVAKKEIYHLKL